MTVLYKTLQYKSMQLTSTTPFRTHLNYKLKTKVLHLILQYKQFEKCIELQKSKVV